MNKILKKRNIWIGGGFFLVIVFLGYAAYSLFFAFYGGTNFRTMQDKIPSTEQVDLTGLRELQASGGYPPRFADLQKRLSHIKNDKIIVDAFGDGYHGYIKGVPTTFLGYAHNVPIFRHMLRRLLWTGTINKISPERVVSEAEEGKKYGFGYKSINIGSKFVTKEKVVDEFVAFIEGLPENVWFHFHCAMGKGRTTMMLVMLDTLRNAPKVALQDIVKRQYILGGYNLMDTALWNNGSYKQVQLDNRKKFIEDFYEFVCQRKAGGTQLWSEWIREKKAP